MALELNPTLAELRAELQARLGFANQGPPSTLGRANLDSMLQRAQEQIWHELQMEQRRAETAITFNNGQTLYDFPDGVAPERIQVVAVFYASTWIKLLRGISYYHDTFIETGANFPQRYDFQGEQLEIWPKPESNYTGKIEHFPALANFTLDADRCSVPGELLFALALYTAKLHYRHPDAEAQLAAYERMRRRYNFGQLANARFVRPTRRRNTPAVTDAAYDPYPRPIRVS